MTAKCLQPPVPLRRDLCGWLVAGITAPWISACTVTPASEKTTSLAFTLDADDEINTNESDVPSPVVVRIYELKATSAFEQASFFELLDNDTAKLGPDLVAKREFELKPGEKKIFTRETPSATRHIGVIAGFRQISAAEWRATADLAEGRDNAFLVKINATTVALTLQHTSAKYGLF